MKPSGAFHSELFFKYLELMSIFLKIKYPPHTGLDQCCQVLRFIKESLVLVPKIFIKTKKHQFCLFIYLKKLKLVGSESRSNIFIITIVKYCNFKMQFITLKKNPFGKNSH
jgi:hypothetical protein